jgi:hypothetical protein
MARKKVEKRVQTVEEQLIEERERSLSFNKDKFKNLNDPTYFFKIGDKVKFGALKESVVEEILFDGKVYGLHCIATNTNYGNPYDYETYNVVGWTDIRPIEYGDTNFAKNQDIKIYFNNSTIESLLHKYYSNGIDMTPDYQRDYVWEQDDKELLIDSIFNNIDIGKFALIHLDYLTYVEREQSYEVLDGKQRINAIVEFYENRFAYKGKFYNDLSWTDRRVFKNHTVSIGEVEDCDKKSVLKYFLMLNRGGKIMDQLHLKKVEEMYEQLK